MKTLTLAQLRAATTCAPQLALFEKLFGAEVEVTEALCLAHASEFSWDLAAYHLLSASAQKAYDEATAPARKDYDEARASAWKAYVEATAPAWKAFNEACAIAFSRVYNS